MKHRMLALVIGIPLASVIFGVVMFYFALTSSDRNLLLDDAPLSKTSWRALEEPSP